MHEFLPWYSSVHRGAGYKSRAATDAYEQARAAILAVRRAAEHGDDVAIICRNTTEAINHLAYRLRLDADDVVVTTVVEHHANLLPWARAARRRFVECGPDGTFTVDDVVAALDAAPRPKLLAITGASNVTGWMPPHRRRSSTPPTSAASRCFVDAAQLAPHRRLPPAVDFVAWSGHKMYAPFGAGVLVGPRARLRRRRPVPRRWRRRRPRRPRRGRVDRPARARRSRLAQRRRRRRAPRRHRRARPHRLAADPTPRRATRPPLRSGLAAIPGVTVLGPGLDTPTLPIATFTVDGVHHALVAARLSAEYGIGVRHGCFCAHPYLCGCCTSPTSRSPPTATPCSDGDRRRMPGAVRASATIATTDADIDRLIDAVAAIATGHPAPVTYQQDEHTGDYWPDNTAPGWTAEDRTLGASCARG